MSLEGEPASSILYLCWHTCQGAILYFYADPRCRFAQPGANGYNASGIGGCCARRAVFALAETSILSCLFL